MNFFKNLKESVVDGIQVFTISGFLIVIFIELLTHIPNFAGAFTVLWKALNPFLFGLIFSFLLLPLRNLLENRMFAKLKLGKKGKRRLSVAICIVLTIVIIVGFFWILIPQMVSSIATFSDNLGGYLDQLQSLLDHFSATEELAPVVDNISGLIDQFGEYVADWLTGDGGGLSQIVNFTLSFGKGILNFLIGLIISVFILADSEMFSRQLTEVTYSILPQQAADSAVYVIRLVRDMFNRFVFGKALDSLIIGIICYPCLRLMNMPYSVLIAVVIGITNMIPFFGPFIGAVPCFLILLLISPIKSIEFAVYILVLQQIDGNIIGPYILGDSMGLPTLWIMFAILVGGSLFGVIGMFVGVPIFSVIYVLFGDWVHSRLHRKRINLNNDTYGTGV